MNIAVKDKSDKTEGPFTYVQGDKDLLLMINSIFVLGE